MSTLMKLVVKKLLENPLAYHWELKGLGMIRTYLDKNNKIHVWDSRYRIPNVSLTHEHPWSFDSYIVAGELHQTRLKLLSTDVKPGQPYMRNTVQCGPGGRLLNEPTLVKLLPGREEIYIEGESYHQHFDEIHQSRPVDGTVTIVTRTSYNGEEEPMRAAPVYWPAGEEWVSSEPLMATPVKIKDICDAALARWFNEEE